MNDETKKRILIVDDSTDILFALRLFFQLKGYAVKTLSEGSGISAEVENFQPDVLLMDVLVCAIDGREICKNLRERAETRDIGILLSSASPAYLKNYKKYANDCIEKPFDLNFLAEKVDSVFLSLPVQKYTIQ